MVLSNRQKIVGALALHLALIAAPGMGALLHMPDVELFGVEVAAKPATPTWTSWRDGEVQAQLQGAMETRLALRGVFVRTENSLYALGHETKPGAQLIFGSHGTLFLNDDIRAYSRRRQDVSATELGEVRALADLTADVHAELNRRGIPLVVIFSPSKTSIYAEDVPEEWRLRGADTIANGAAPADTFRERLKERGVPFTNAATVLHAHFGNDEVERERLFSRLGRHWTPVGTCMVLSEALEPFVPNLSCATTTLRVSMKLHWDRDLYRLLNIWELRGSEDSVLPTSVVRPGSTVRPLLVGTSFSLGLVEWLRGVTPDVARLFYYNRRVIEDTTMRSDDLGAIDSSSPTWLHYTSDRNLIILEILETYANADYARNFLLALREHLPDPVNR